MKRLLAILLSVWFPSMAAAQLEPTPTAPPKAVIEGPTSGLPGDLVIFRIGEGSRGKTFKWLLVPDRPFLRGDGGTSIGFASRTPAVFTIILVAIEGDDAGYATHEYRNGVGPAPPGPNPPAPDPLSDLAYSEAMKVDAGARASAPLLTASYVRLAATARSGSHDKWTVGQFMGNVVRVENRKALGDQAVAWGAWSAAMSKAFKALWDDGKIEEVKDLADPFDRIAAGLRRVR